MRYGAVKVILKLDRGVTINRVINDPVSFIVLIDVVLKVSGNGENI